MARGIRRFDRRVRPAEDTDVFPAVKDDDDTGEIPVPDAEHDDEVTPSLETDLESQDADADRRAAQIDDDDRLAKLREPSPSVAHVPVAAPGPTRPLLCWPGWPVSCEVGCRRWAGRYGRG